MRCLIAGVGICIFGVIGFEMNTIAQQKEPLSRTGYIQEESDITPIDSYNSGATFDASGRVCGGVNKQGYFAHPGWKGDAAGCPAFGEFEIDLSKPGQIVAVAAEPKKPKKVEAKKGEEVVEEEPEFEIMEGIVKPRVKEFKYLGKNEFSITYEWLVSKKIEEDYTIFIHFVNAEYGDKERGDIAFQGDHRPLSPTMGWKEKSSFIDGPFRMSVPSNCGPGVYYISLGLYNERGRFRDIAGPNDGTNRTVIGKLIISGKPGKVKEIRFEKLKCMKQEILKPFAPGANIFPLGNAPIFKILKPIKIDGNLDDWPQEIMDVPIAISEKKQLTIEDEEWKGSLDFGSTFFLCWDKDNFYLAEVRSDDVLLFQDTTSRDFYQSDYLRIYFSKESKDIMPGKDDYLFVILPREKPIIKLCSYDGYEHKDFNYKAVEISSKLFDKGWIMEIKIPFSSIGMIPQSGQTLGFQIVIGDSDKIGKRIHEMLWKPAPPNSKDYWFNPQTFGRLTFCENSFCWAGIDKEIYLPSEVPLATIGIYTVKPGDELTGEIILKDRAGNVIDKKTYSSKVESNQKQIPVKLSSFKSEGEYSIENSSKYQNQIFTSSVSLKAFAMRARERKSLLALAQPSKPTIIPSVDAVKYTNSVRQEGKKYIFEYKGEDGTVSYEYIPGPSLNITILVNGVLLHRCDPSYNGPWIIIGTKSYASGMLDSKVLNAKLENDKLSYTCEVTCEGENIKLAYSVSIRGKSLIIDVSSPQALFNTFMGPLAGVPAKEINIPYMNWIKVFDFHNSFLSSYFNWTKTGCSQMGPEGPCAYYSPKTDGTRNPLQESLYLVVSDDLLEVLPNLPNPKTPFMNVLSDRVVLDWWTADQYTDSAKYLQVLKDYGVDKLAIIYHVWQRYGYDEKLPAHVPANPRMGGDEGMKILCAKAKELGYVFSLHENYIDYYPDYPEYTESAVAIDQNRNRINAYYHPRTKIQSFRLKPTWIEKYARQESPEINKRYQTTAAYLDVQPTGPPWQLDYDAEEEGAASFKYVFDKLTWLYNFERETHGGPLFGEGRNHAFWAGRVDGCEAQIAGGQYCPMLIDFDLLKVHPLMVNHGMGYYSRWFERSGQVSRAWTEADIDKYRSQEIAYGHAGFIDTIFHKNLTQALREYYLTQPLMARYCPALPEKLLYLVGDKWVNSNVVCRTDAPRKIYVKYTSGLELWVNNEEDGWNIEGYILPSFGFLGKGAGAISTTAKFNGIIGDYSETPEWIFADPRTNEVYKMKKLKIEPQLAEFKYLGERKFQIKYKWIAGEPADINYTCFVHFTDESGRILYQNDHALPKPSSKWTAGEVIQDGPYTIEIPQEFDLDFYDIRIGLYDAPPGSGRRADMEGKNDRVGRYIIGKIIVEQKYGEIKNLKVSIEKEKKEELAIRRNPAGTLVDFGTLITDGTIRINKEKNGLTILPIPHGYKFNITLRLSKILGKPAKVVKITALDKDKKEIGKVDYKEIAPGEINFTGIYPDAWYYRVLIPFSEG